MIIDIKEYQWYNCYISWKGWDYSVAELIKCADTVETITAPIQALDMTYNLLDEKDLLSFAEHMLRVNNSDTSYPLILAPDGFLLDGRHRLVKLILNDSDTVKIKRLKDMPAPYRKTEH